VKWWCGGGVELVVVVVWVFCCLTHDQQRKRNRNRTSQQEVLDESLNMLPDCDRRLAAALLELRTQLDDVTATRGDLAEDAIVLRAKALLA
jgi:hypothetical protein